MATAAAAPAATNKQRVNIYTAQALPPSAVPCKPFLALRFRNSTAPDNRQARRTPAHADAINPAWNVAVDVDVLPGDDLLEVRLLGETAQGMTSLGDLVARLADIPKNCQCWLPLAGGGQIMIALPAPAGTPTQTTQEAPPQTATPQPQGALPPAQQQQAPQQPPAAQQSPPVQTPQPATPAPTEPIVGYLDYRVLEARLSAPVSGPVLCKMTFGTKQNQTTPHTNEGPAPAWNQTFRMPLGVGVQKMKLDVIVREPTADKLVGTGEHDLSVLLRARAEQAWVVINGPYQSQVGSVHIQFLFTPDANAPAAPAPTGPTPEQIAAQQQEQAARAAQEAAAAAKAQSEAAAAAARAEADAAARSQAEAQAQAFALAQQQAQTQQQVQSLAQQLQQANEMTNSALQRAEAAERQTQELAQQVRELQTQLQASRAQSAVQNEGVSKEQLDFVRAQLRGMEERARVAEAEVSRLRGSASTFATSTPTYQNPVGASSSFQSRSLATVAVSPQVQKLLAEQEAWLEQLRSRTSSSRSVFAPQTSSSAVPQRNFGGGNEDLPSMLL